MILAALEHLRIFKEKDIIINQFMGEKRRRKRNVTRLEILSRPKAPKILQELLRNSKELPSPRPTKLLKSFKRFQNIKKIQKDFKRI